MSHTITKYDANILNHHAKSGDALELGRTLDNLAQREAPNGYGRADILLLAKDETGDIVAQAAFLNRHAKSGDVLEFRRTLDNIAQREAPDGYDRADILLLANDSQLPRQEWRRLGVSQNTRPTGPARGSEDPNGFDRADILLLAKDEAGDNNGHSACAFGNTTELIFGGRQSRNSSWMTWRVQP